MKKIIFYLLSLAFIVTALIFFAQHPESRRHAFMAGVLTILGVTMNAFCYFYLYVRRP